MNLMKYTFYSLFWLFLSAATIQPTAAFVAPLFDQAKKDAAPYASNPESAPANPLAFVPFDKKMVIIRVMNGINGAHLGYLSVAPDAQGRWSRENWQVPVIIPTIAPYDERLLAKAETQFKFIVYPSERQFITLSTPMAGAWNDSDIGRTNHLQRTNNDNYELPVFDNGGLGSWEGWIPLGNPSNFVLKNREDGRLLCKDANSMYVKSYMTKYNANPSWAALSKGIPPLVFELMTIDQLRDAINQRKASETAAQQAALQAQQAATADVAQSLAAIAAFKDPVRTGADQAEAAAATLDDLLSAVQTAVQALNAQAAQDAAKNALAQIKILDNLVKEHQRSVNQAQPIAAKYPAGNPDAALKAQIAASFKEIADNYARITAAAARAKGVNQQIQDAATTTSKSAASQAEVNARVAKFSQLGVASGSYIALQVMSQTTNTDAYLTCATDGLLAANGNSLLDPATHLQILSRDGLVTLGAMGKRIKIDKVQGSKAFVVAAAAVDDSQLFEVDGARSECYFLSRLNKGALTILSDGTFGVVDNNSSKLLPLTKTMDAAFRVVSVSSLQHELALAQSKAPSDRADVYVAQSKKARTADDRDLFVRALLDFVAASQKQPATWKAVKQAAGDKLTALVTTLLADPNFADQKVYLGQVNDKLTADDRQAAAEAQKAKNQASLRNQAYNRLGLGSVTVIALKSHATGNCLMVTQGAKETGGIATVTANGEDSLNIACQFQIVRNVDGFVGFRSSVAGDRMLQAQAAGGDQAGAARFVRPDFADLECFEIDGSADQLYLKHKATGGYLTVAEDGSLSVNDPVAIGFMPAERLDNAEFEIVKLSAVHREVALLTGKSAKDKITRLDALVKERKATTDEMRSLIIDTFKSTIDAAMADKKNWDAIKADVLNPSKTLIQRLRDASKDYGSYADTIAAIEDKVLADERAQAKTAEQFKADVDARNQRVNRLGVTGGLIRIQCNLNGKNIRATDDGGLKVDGTNPLDVAAQWQCTRTPEGFLIIKSSAGKVLYAQQAPPSAGKLLLGDADKIPQADQLFNPEGTKNEGYLQHVSTKGYVFLTNDGDLVINDPATDQFLPMQKTSDTALMFIPISVVARDLAAQKDKPLKERLKAFPMMINRATTSDTQALVVTALQGYVEEIQKNFDMWSKAQADAELMTALRAAIASLQGNDRFAAQKSLFDTLNARIDGVSPLTPRWTVVEPDKGLAFGARVVALGDQLAKMMLPDDTQKKAVLDVVKGIAVDRVSASPAELGSLKALLLKMKQGFYKGKDDALYRTEMDNQLKVLSGSVSVADKIAFLKSLYDDGLINPAKNSLFAAKLREITPLVTSATDAERKQLTDFLNGLIKEGEYAPELKRLAPAMRRVLESLSTIDETTIEQSGNKEMPQEGTAVLVVSLKNGKFLRFDGKALRADGDDQLSPSCQFTVVRARGAMTLKTVMDSGVVLKADASGKAVMIDTQYADEKSVAAQWDMIGMQDAFSLQNRAMQGLLSTKDDGSLVALVAGKPVTKKDREEYKFVLITPFMQALSSSRSLSDGERLAAYTSSLLGQVKAPSDRALFVADVSQFVASKQKNKANWEVFSSNDALMNLLQSLIDSLGSNAAFVDQKTAIAALREKVLLAELSDNEPYAPIADRLKEFTDQVKMLKDASKEIKASFLSSLGLLINDRVDATPPQYKSIGELLKVAKYNVFAGDDASRKTLDGFIATVTKPIAFSDRVDAARNLYKNGLTTPELKKLFLNRLQATVLNRARASIDQLKDFLNFVQATLDEVQYIDDLQDVIKPLTQLVTALTPLVNAAPATTSVAVNAQVPANKSLIALQLPSTSKFIRVVNGKYLVADAADSASAETLFEVNAAPGGAIMLNSWPKKQWVGSPARGQTDAGMVLLVQGAGDTSQQFTFEGTQLATNLKNVGTQGYLAVQPDGKLITAHTSEDDPDVYIPVTKEEAGLLRTVVLSAFEQSLARGQSLSESDRLTLYAQSVFKAERPSEKAALVGALSDFVDQKRSAPVLWQQFTANQALSGQLDLILNALGGNPSFGALKDTIQAISAKVKVPAGQEADDKEQGMTFAERIAKLTQSMKTMNVKDEEQVNAFMDAVAQAVNARVDATPRDLNAFKALLVRAQALFKIDKKVKDQLVDAAKRAAEPVPFSDRYDLVQDMIDDGVVTKEEQGLLMRRLRALVTDVGLATADERKDLETLVSDFADNVEYDDTLKGLKLPLADIKKSLETALKKAPLKKDADPTVRSVAQDQLPALNQNTSFVDQVAQVSKNMKMVQTDDQRDQFLGQVQQVVSSRTPADSADELLKLLKAAVMFIFKDDEVRGSVLEGLIAQVSKPLTFTDILASAQHMFNGDLTASAAVEAFIAQLSLVVKSIPSASSTDKDNAQTFLMSVSAAAQYSPLLKDKIGMIDDALKKLAGPSDQILALLGSINTPKDDASRRQQVDALKAAFFVLQTDPVQWAKSKANTDTFNKIGQVIKAFLFNPAYRAFSGEVKELESLATISSTKQIVFAANDAQARWLTDDIFAIPSGGKGLFSFLVRAASTDLKVVLATEPKDDASGYELTVGEAFDDQENQQTVLRRNGQLDPLVQIDGSENIEAILVPGVQETFWIRIDGATISFGKGDVSSDPLLVYTDPTPVIGLRFIGFRSAAKPYSISALDIKSF